MRDVEFPSQGYFADLDLLAELCRDLVDVTA